MYDMVEKIDGLLRESRLDEAYEYMKAELSAADERGDVPAVMYLLAELAGFCRDTGRMQESIGYAERAEREFPADRDSSEYTAVLLNLANAYRAGGDKRAYEVYARIDELTRRWPEHRAPYHNNYALLLQDDGRFAEAAEELRAALPLVEDDQRRTAITKANLSVCLLHEGDTDGAETMARESLRWFEGQLPSDFHCSAALAAMGDICAAKGDKDKASWYYEAALSEIELHMGRCGFWDIVDEKLKDIYSGSRPHISGLELSRRYFDTFFRPAIKGLTEMCPSLADKVTIGLVGEGSECFGFDDERSFDHDMGPSFCIFADDDVPDEDYKKLVWAYDMLPRTYYGMSYTVGSMPMSDAVSCAHPISSAVS
ncbi:MAG: tetratricopeptide repeat protein [Oscillospiraceae bacterium]|nr:tetratricopeptide repeat protein [Oscillospiraceae bacterium]